MPGRQLALATFAAVPDEPSDADRAAAFAAFRARLRAAQDPSDVAAALARVRAAQARQDPPETRSSDPAPATPPAAPRNPKSSVSAHDREAASDLREHPVKPGAENGGLGDRYEQRNNRQQARMRMLDEARALTTLYSLKRCGAMPLGGAVSVTQKGDGSGGFAGLFRCGSVWACPECMPVVRAERAANLETWAGAWIGAGHGLAMATLTTKHWKHARLGPQIDGTATAWRKLQAGAWWAGRTRADGTRVPGFRERHGLVGVTRAMEMTHSWANSWHTHLHVLLWFEDEVTADKARQVEAELYDRWAVLVRRANLGKPTRKHGVKVDPVRRGKQGAADLARYVVKVLDKDDEKSPEKALGNELLRGDMKSGRQPLEILRRALAGDEAEQELWKEYEQATKGRRMLTWGGDIKDRLAELVDVDERDDQEVVLAEDARNTRAVLVQVTPQPWREKVAATPGRRGQVRVAVKVASDAATKAGLDIEHAARTAVRELLESWGLVWGEHIYGPDVDLETGEVTGERITPPAPPKRRTAVRWHSRNELDATREVLGITPHDWVRPERAARRAKGLPVAPALRAEAVTGTSNH